MTDYVLFQMEVIDVLFKIIKDDPAFLVGLVKRCRSCKTVGQEDLNVLLMNGLELLDAGWKKKFLIEIIREQVDDTGPTVTIRNLLGDKLFDHGDPSSSEQYVKLKGSGQNNLRTMRLAQPRALQVGDILATGCRVISPPREGGNASVLIHLSGGERGEWISVPARIPIALLTREDGVLASLTNSE